MIFLKLFYLFINNQNIFNRRFSKMYLSHKIKISDKINLLSKIKLSGKRDKLIDDKNVVEYMPKSVKQKEYKKSLYNPNIDLLFGMGPAGTGKTLFACQFAIDSLKNNKINKIIITRPAISIEEDMGFLPGDINSKMYPYTIPIFDIFEEYYTKKELTNLVFENIIEIAPLGFMQGRTFKNSIIIADEMQNSTPNQMLMLLTRIGLNSKMVVTGDLMQTKIKDNGLYDIIYKLKNNYPTREDMLNDGIDIIKLESSDIQRSNIVKIINNIYNK